MKNYLQTIFIFFYFYKVYITRKKLADYYKGCNIFRNYKLQIKKKKEIKMSNNFSCDFYNIGSFIKMELQF